TKQFIACPSHSNIKRTVIARFICFCFLWLQKFIFAMGSIDVVVLHGTIKYSISVPLALRCNSKSVTVQELAK
uniref:Uncharacterized protein n=1 Tax=Strigamia maritima TaxID=126957 RepID=T1JIK7_STRMM